MISDGLWDSFNNYHMEAPPNIRARRPISPRTAGRVCLQFAPEAVAAMQAGKFKEEIFDIAVPQKKGDPKMFNVDECPRPDVSLESLAKLRPAFEKDGTVTAGNAPG